jgi:hypothetical protein
MKILLDTHFHLVMCMMNRNLPVAMENCAVGTQYW